MIIGIDFGTSKSVVAVWDERTSTIIPDLQGNTVMPSLVLVAPDEQLYIGWEALNHPLRYQSEYFTISSIKRMIGKAGETEWGGHFRTYPQEVSALILGRLKMQAEAYYDCEITRAVIAVPAHYNINQRWSTKQAAEIAGLKAYRLINEATAAVLAYNTLHKKEESMPLVFDFGGGTLDVSIVEFGEGMCEVKATSGHDRLGGDDFDQIIVDYLLEDVKKKVGASIELTPIQQFVLKDAATKAKIELSDSLTTRIYLPRFIHTENRNWDLDVSLDRDTFERLCSTLFDRADTVLENALKNSYVNLQSINEVILIGGTSRIPHIKKRISNIMRLHPIIEIAPEYVAHGASIHAGILNGKLKEILLMDVVPRSYGVQSLGGVFDKLIERNTTIPTKRSHLLSTLWDNQTEVVVSVAEGEREMFANNTFVGELRLSGISPAPRGVPQIKVIFEIYADNTLAVSAEDKATGRKIETVMESPYRMNPAQIKVLQRKVHHELQSLQQREANAWEQRRNSVLRDKAIACAKEIENFLTVYGGFLEDKHMSLLAAGKELIHDYLDRNVSRADLKSLISSISYSRDDAIISIMVRTVKSIVASPLFDQWATEITSNYRTPKVLKESINEFKRCFMEEIDSIVTFFQSRDADIQEILKQRLLARVKDTPIEALCIALILRQFTRLDIDIKDLNITEAYDQPLLSIFLLYELSERSSGLEARKTVAQEIYNIYKGTNCFFLCEYVRKYDDEQVVYWLEKCLREIPPGVWFKHYLDAASVEREWFKGNSVALKELQRDLIWGLNRLGSEAQLIALETLKELGSEGCLSDLLPILAVKMDDSVKIKLITLIASSQNEQVILPLIKMLVNENLVVRGTALVALEGCRNLMAPDIRRFFELAQRIIGHGTSLRFHERFFLRKFASEHKELSEVVKLIKGEKK